MTQISRADVLARLAKHQAPAEAARLFAAALAEAGLPDREAYTADEVLALSRATAAIAARVMRGAPSP
jgi:hypothetical protein